MMPIPVWAPTRARYVFGFGLFALWTAIAAADLVFQLVGGPARAPDSWRVPLEYVDAVYQIQPAMTLAAVLLARRARARGEEVDASRLATLGLLVGLPVAAVGMAAIMVVAITPLLNYLAWPLAIAYEAVIAPLAIVSTIVTLVRVGLRRARYGPARAVPPISAADPPPS